VIKKKGSDKNIKGIIMTTKHRYKEATTKGMYFVEERQKSAWKIVHICYSIPKCKQHIEMLEKANKRGKNV